MGYKIRVDVDSYKEDFNDLSGVAISLFEENNIIASGTTDNNAVLQLNVDRTNANDNSPTMLKVLATKTGYKDSFGMAIRTDEVNDNGVQRFNHRIKPILPAMLPPPNLDEPLP